MKERRQLQSILLLKPYKNIKPYQLVTKLQSTARNVLFSVSFLTIQLKQ